MVNRLADYLIQSENLTDLEDEEVIGFHNEAKRMLLAAIAAERSKP